MFEAKRKETNKRFSMMNDKPYLDKSKQQLHIHYQNKNNNKLLQKLHLHHALLKVIMPIFYIWLVYKCYIML